VIVLGGDAGTPRVGVGYIQMSKGRGGRFYSGGASRFVLSHFI